jgi:hypothetical protein
MESDKSRFLVPNVSSGNETVCRAQYVAREPRIERARFAVRLYYVFGLTTAAGASFLYGDNIKLINMLKRLTVNSIFGDFVKKLAETNVL